MLDWMHSEQVTKRFWCPHFALWRMVLHIPTCVIIIFKYYWNEWILTWLSTNVFVNPAASSIVVLLHSIYIHLIRGICFYNPFAFNRQVKTFMEKYYWKKGGEKLYCLLLSPSHENFPTFFFLFGIWCKGEVPLYL